VETGKGADALERRPQLSAALTVAKQHKAPIIVAKDRIGRPTNSSDTDPLDGARTIPWRTSWRLYVPW